MTPTGPTFALPGSLVDGIAFLVAHGSHLRITRLGSAEDGWSSTNSVSYLFRLTDNVLSWVCRWLGAYRFTLVSIQECINLMPDQPNQGYVTQELVLNGYVVIVNECSVVSVVSCDCICSSAARWRYRKI